MIGRGLLKVVAGSALALALLVSSACASNGKQLKVYILAGQSNMEGHAHVRTFPHLAMDPDTVPLLKLMQDDEGNARVAERVWISYLTGLKESIVKEGKLTTGFGAQKGGPKIGPEFTFGLTLEQHMDNPILLIKTAWGGQSLHTDFRPPSGAEDGVAGKRYTEMIAHVQTVLADPGSVCPAYDEKAGYDVAGFVWFQGWNDMVARNIYPERHKPGGYDLYSELLAHFIRDVRKDLSVPGMPFVIGVMGAGGPTKDYESTRYQGIHQNFRDAMAAPASLPEFKGNVYAVLTETCWDAQLGELDRRWGKVKQRNRDLSKDESLSKEQRKAAAEKFIAESFTTEELKIREVGISNFGFHYLGSGKVLARIGQAFARQLLPKGH